MTNKGITRLLSGLVVVVALASAVAAGAAADETSSRTAATAESGAAKSDAAMIARGRYVVRIAGCNDCHTSGYAQAGGKVPERRWLTGDPVGFRGPWGTSYPTNLRLFMQTLNENEWVTFARHLKARPPMPWFTLHYMKEADLRAIYRFIRHLGPAGTPAPVAVAPNAEPTTAYIVFVPRAPGGHKKK